MQRRLDECEINELVAEYQAGRTLAALAADLGITNAPSRPISNVAGSIDEQIARN